MFLMQYFCLHNILPFSKSFPETESTWPTVKCRGSKSFDTSHYIVTCAMLCVSFSLKSKVINVFCKVATTACFNIFIKNWCFNRLARHSLVTKTFWQYFSPKHILRSKAGDQSIQARGELFCHMIIKNYLCNATFHESFWSELKACGGVK